MVRGRFQGKTLFAAGRFQGKTLFAAAVFVASVLVLALKLLNPTPVQILVEGNTAITAQVPGLFTYADVFVIAVALVLMSVSGTYILLQDSTPAAAAPAAAAPASAGDIIAAAAPASAGDIILEERRQRWEGVAKTLKDDEQTLFKAIIDEGIVHQSELVEKTGLPKSNVSRALYGLESKGLIERRRRGMGNVILLK
ncbi:MAG TPA: MarR family transcriptional regulator [Candidatus Bathyarchaeia archaeon]|nr:MarR family transcriptional regulator [Candidatus Bathyarchaeia archaeon]